MIAKKKLEKASCAYAGMLEKEKAEQKRKNKRVLNGLNRFERPKKTFL